MKYRNIIVAGDIGTGTTTLAKNLADKLGWKIVSVGDFFRKYAKEHNIPLWDKEAVDDNFEREVDQEITRKLKEEKNLVVDSHYAAWFLKGDNEVFKILLLCDKNIATKRIISRKHTHKETPEEVEKRRQGLYRKFKKLYSSENYEDPKIFNLVIDTTNSSIEETLSIALKAVKNKSFQKRH